MAASGDVGSDPAVRLAYRWCAASPGYPTVVCLHGLGSDSSEIGGFFDLLRRNLERSGFGSVAFDLPGSLRTGISGTEFHTDEVVDEILMTLERLVPGGDLVMAGFSHGGYLALRVAAKHIAAACILWSLPEDLALTLSRRLVEGTPVQGGTRVDLGFRTIDLPNDFAKSVEDATVEALLAGLGSTPTLVVAAVEAVTDCNTANTATRLLSNADAFLTHGGHTLGLLDTQAAVDRLAAISQAWLASRLGLGNLAASPVDPPMQSPATVGELDERDALRILQSSHLLGDTAVISHFATSFERFEEIGRNLGELAGAWEARAELLRVEPQLWSLLKTDIKDAASRNRWGRSTCVDELTGTQTLAPAVVELLSDICEEDARPENLHAGMAHVYGYLLSTEPTKFGRKRHRWTSGEVARTLGLSPGWPLDSGQPLVAEVTAALCCVAPLDGWDSADVVHEAAAVLVGERVDVNGTLNWRARTRLFSRPGTREGAEVLLVYSLRESHGPERYITAFTMSEKSARDVVFEPMGTTRLRYNAVASLEGTDGPA
jgi:pimeloyl-ACP methyl ester carboxylesterase